MSRLLLVLSVLALVVSPAVSIAGGPSFLIAVQFGTPRVAAHLERQADFVAIPLEIQSRTKKAVVRFSEIEASLRVVVAEARSNPNVAIRRGNVSLSPREGGSFLGSKYGRRDSSADLYLIVELTEERDVFAATRLAWDLVEKVRPVGDATFSIGEARLGLEEPERFRGELLDSIAKEVELLKQHLSSEGSVQVGGLESPVMVLQKNAKEVVILLDYTISLSY